MGVKIYVHMVVENGMIDSGDLDGVWVGVDDDKLINGYSVLYLDDEYLKALTGPFYNLSM